MKRGQEKDKQGSGQQDAGPTQVSSENTGNGIFGFYSMHSTDQVSSLASGRGIVNNGLFGVNAMVPSFKPKPGPH